MTLLKKCTKCGEEKPATKEFFSWSVTRLRSYCKKCGAENFKIYYDKNKDKCQRVSTEWKSKNKEQCEQYRKRYYTENKQQERKVYKEWMARNPNYFKEYQHKNKAKLTEKSSKWRKQNYSRYLTNVRTLRAKKKKENPDEYYLLQRVYYYKNREKIKERCRVRANVRTEELSDTYIRTRIKKQFGVSHPPQQLIEIKRKVIKGRRMTKRLKQKIKQWQQ